MGFFDKLKKINIFAGFGSELTDDFYDELEEIGRASCRERV